MKRHPWAHSGVVAPSGGETTRIAHWDRVYSRLGETQVSWFETAPTQSLVLFDLLGVTPECSVLDVGAGASRLVDALLARGFTDLTVLDVSAEGLELTRERLGRAGRGVQWVVADILTWQPERHYDTWHDRAVFHFLTEPADRGRYLGTLRTALASGGTVVLATFAEDGPRRCSGLPVSRYSAAELTTVLGTDFTPVASERVEHRTPSGVVQPFTWVAGRFGQPPTGPPRHCGRSR